jgi:hypothetical protein
MELVDYNAVPSWKNQEPPSTSWRAALESTGAGSQ